MGSMGLATVVVADCKVAVVSEAPEWKSSSTGWQFLDGPAGCANTKGGWLTSSRQVSNLNVNVINVPSISVNISYIYVMSSFRVMGA